MIFHKKMVLEQMQETKSIFYHFYPKSIFKLVSGPWDGKNRIRLENSVWRIVFLLTLMLRDAPSIFFFFRRIGSYSP